MSCLTSACSKWPRLLQPAAPSSPARPLPQRRPKTAAQPLALIGDRHELEILLRNLVDNALQHGGQKGLVEVAALCIEGRPALRVTDQGPGIPAAARAGVQAFLQAQRRHGRRGRRPAGRGGHRQWPGPVVLVLFKAG